MFIPRYIAFQACTESNLQQFGVYSNRRKTVTAFRRTILVLSTGLKIKAKKSNPTNQNKKKQVCTSSTIKALYEKCSKDIMSSYAE